MNEPTLCMNVWGGRGGDQLVFATKEIRTPKATSNKSTLSDPHPKKKIRKIKEEFMKEKHKAKDYYNTISKLWTDDQRICQDERKQRSHHINSSLLWISSSMNEWMNAWQIFGGSIFRWLIQTTCGVHLCCWRIGTLDQQFLLHLPTQYLIATVGWVLPNLFPFQRENRRVSFGYVKPLAGWLADGSCKQLKELGFGPHTIAWFSKNLQRTVQKP